MTHTLRLLPLLLVASAACSTPPTSTAEDMSTTEDMPGVTPDMTATPDETPDVAPDLAPDMPTTPVDPNATCDTTPQSPRCGADPGTFAAWDPASVLSDITFIADEACCFDLDGDGANNNALGEILTLAANFDVDIDAINESIQASLQDGSVVLLVEHQNLTPEGGDFSINYYLGDQDGDFTTPDVAGANPYTIDPDSLTQGVWPSARMANATLTGDAVVAGPGTVTIETSLFGPPIALNIIAAQLSATVEDAQTNLTDGTGVRLVDGKLGGAVRVSEIFDAINDYYTETCTCAAVPGGEPFITYDVASLKDAECTAPDIDTSACDPESVCVSIHDFCAVAGIAGLAADIDADNIAGDCQLSNTCDSISLASDFETVGARLTGVQAP